MNALFLLRNKVLQVVCVYSSTAKHKVAHPIVFVTKVHDIVFKHRHDNPDSPELFAILVSTLVSSREFSTTTLQMGEYRKR